MMNSDAAYSPAELIGSTVRRIAARIGDRVFGQDTAANLLAGAFVIGGHVLLEGPPGIAKTLMARTFAEALALRFKRIQFTPDLMPSDVTGVYVFDPKSVSFRFAPGPVFADILLADEINRTPPKTQSSLLEAMEERAVTIDGMRHQLGELFFVIATQNPIEHEGTFPLPEAQLDRFLFKVMVTYPQADQEEAMISRLSAEMPRYDASSEKDTGAAPGVVTKEELLQARAALRTIALAPELAAYIRRVVAETRQHSDLSLGASPRAALNLALAGKLNAALAGRDYTIPDDVRAAAPAVLGHRLILHPELLGDPQQISRVIGEVLARVPVPDRVLQ